MDIESFIEHLRTRTCSEETIRAYRGDLEKYQQFLHSRGLRVNQATVQTVDQFIDHLSSQPTRKAGAQLAAASISRRLSVISKFYEYLRARSHGKITNPVLAVERPRIQNDLPRALDESAAQRLLEEITDPRDRALIGMFIWSGLRLSELYQLDKTTISRRQRRMPDGSIRIVGYADVIGKGSKRRSFLIDEQTVNSVIEYLRQRGPDDTPALFISARRKRLSRRSIQDILHRWCHRLQLDRVHVHQLRHTFATRMANAGMSSTVLKDLLGHSSFTATQRYFRIRPERLAREYFAAYEYLSPPKP